MTKVKSVKYAKSSAELDRGALNTVVYHLGALEALYQRPAPATELELAQKIIEAIDFINTISYRDVFASEQDNKIPRSKLQNLKNLIELFSSKEGFEEQTRTLIYRAAKILISYRPAFIRLLDSFDKKIEKAKKSLNPPAGAAAKIAFAEKYSSSPKSFVFFSSANTNDSQDQMFEGDLELHLNSILDEFDYRKELYYPKLQNYHNLLIQYEGINEITRIDVSLVINIFNKLSELLVNNTLSISPDIEINESFAYKEPRKFRNFFTHIIDYPFQIYNLENIFIENPEYFHMLIKFNLGVINWISKHANDDSDQTKMNQRMALADIHALKEAVFAKLPKGFNNVSDNKLLLLNLFENFKKQLDLVLDAVPDKVKQAKADELQDKFNEISTEEMLILEQQVEILGELAAKFVGKELVPGAIESFIESIPDSSEKEYYISLLDDDNRGKAIFSEISKQIIDYRNNIAHTHINTGLADFCVYIKRFRNFINQTMTNLQEKFEKDYERAPHLTHPRS